MYYVGIDGGGTTSDYCLMTEGFDIIKEGVNGATNINSHGRQAVKNHLDKGLTDLLAGQNIDKNQVMVTLSSAGVDRPEDKKPYEDILEDLGFIHCLITNDAEAALSAGSQGRDGMIVIAGTGSIVFSKRVNVLQRVGGWGHLLGDQGSAYKIAMTALEKILQDADGYGEKTVVEALILKAIGGTCVEDLIPYVYTESFKKDKLAGLAKYVDQGAMQGDCVAIDIIESQARALADQVKALYKKAFEGEGPVPLVLNGSVLKKSRLFYKTFVAALDAYPLEFIILDINAAIGAAYLGHKKVVDDACIC